MPLFMVELVVGFICDNRIDRSVAVVDQARKAFIAIDFLASREDEDEGWAVFDVDPDCPSGGAPFLDGGQRVMERDAVKVYVGGSVDVDVFVDADAEAVGADDVVRASEKIGLFLQGPVEVDRDRVVERR